MTCAFADEAPHPFGVVRHLSRWLARSQNVKSFLLTAGVSEASPRMSFRRVAQRLSDRIWCLIPGRDGALRRSLRVHGRALFPFSGQLIYTRSPVLALHFIGDFCLAVATRDFESGALLSVRRALCSQCSGVAT